MQTLTPQQNWLTSLACVVALCFTIAAPVPRANGCPFCSAPSLTLSEQLAQSDAAALVQWKSGQPGNREEGDIGSTTYEIVQVVQKGSPGLKQGEDVTLPRFRPGKAGDLFLLLGTQGTSIEWSSPLEITETSFNYIRQAPPPETPTTQRLEYFVKFLEYPDPLVSNDAYAEFANAPYSDIVPLADKLSPEQLRKWVTDPETAPTRLGLYGLLLGLCGTSDDAGVMQQQILAPSEEFRLGIDGVMAGYLLITGAEGLDVIDREKLQNKEIPFSETYAAMQALRFMWTDGKERIPAERLRQSMRILLDRPELADLVIADLARWQDWSVLDRLMTLYDAEEYGIPSIKRAIVRYLLVASKGKGEDAAPAHAAEIARKHLADLRERDPKTVEQAERFYFVN